MWTEERRLVVVAWRTVECGGERVTPVGASSLWRSEMEQKLHLCFAFRNVHAVNTTSSSAFRSVPQIRQQHRREHRHPAVHRPPTYPTTHPPPTFSFSDSLSFVHSEV